MKRISSIILFLLAAYAGMAQMRYTQVLVQLENESPLFAALHQQLEAQQLAAKAGSLLDNPEVEFALFRGTPGEVGNRWDLGVTQQFDFPTAYKHKARIRRLAAAGAEIDYRVRRQELIMEAQLLCADIVYYNALVENYTRCAATADSLALLYQKRFENGDCNIIDFNRVQMESSEAQNKLALAIAERDMLLGELQVLNGGQNVSFNQTSYEPVALPSSFESWYREMEQSNPALAQLESQLNISQSEYSLARSESLPSFSVGYASENTTGEVFRGAKVGMTLPLWKNRGQVKKSMAEQHVAEVELSNARLSYYNHLRGLYNKVSALKKNVDRLNLTFSNHGSTALLQKAFAASEISLEEYLLGIDFYNDAAVSLLEAQHELEQAVIELYTTTGIK
ncbi:MAG: TolC family protein [Bacteroidales bacterium]|nr:TolC family protein [Bacteroidales bacterium]